MKTLNFNTHSLKLQKKLKNMADSGNVQDFS